MAKQGKIGISLDTSEFSRSLVSIQRQLKGLEKSQIEIFNKESVSGLKELKSGIVKDLQSQFKNINKELSDQLKLMNGMAKGSKEYADQMERVKDNLYKLGHVSESLKSLKPGGFMSGLSMGRGGLGGLSMGGMSGMGAAGLLGVTGGLALAGIAGAGLYGYSRLRAGYGTYMSGLDDRLLLRGRGYGTLPSGSAMGGAGLSSLDFRRLQYGSSEYLGGTGATNEAVLGRAQFERARGLQQGTLLSIGQGMSSTLGGAGATKALMAIQAGLIAGEMKDELGPYLETAASMLTNINSSGFSFDDSAISALNDLYASNKNLNFSAGLITGVDQAIKTAQGPSAAFMMQSFSRAGIGAPAGSALGLQAAMQMGGLFGADVSKYGLTKGGMSETVLKKLSGGPEHFRKLAGGIVDSLAVYGEGEEGHLARLSAMQRMGYGGKNIGEAGAIYDALLRGRKGGSNVNAIIKEIENLNKGVDEKSLDMLKTLNATNEGIASALDNQKQSMQDALGATIVGPMNEINQTLLNIDRYIMSLTEGLSNVFFFDTPKKQLEGALKGKIPLEGAGLDMAKNLSSEELEAAKKMAIRSASGQNKTFAEHAMATSPLTGLYQAIKSISQMNNAQETVKSLSELIELGKRKEAREIQASKRRIGEVPTAD